MSNVREKERNILILAKIWPFDGDFSDAAYT